MKHIPQKPRGQSTAEAAMKALESVWAMQALSDVVDEWTESNRKILERAIRDYSVRQSSPNKTE